MSPEGPQAFGALLQRHRLAAGLSQAELAERAGLSARGISDLERGLRKAPYPATLRRLAEALDLTQGDRGVLLAAVQPRAGSSSASNSPATPGGQSGKATEAHVASGQPGHPFDGSGGHTLPSSLSPLIGRDAEMAALRQRLAPPVRLLTLTGPGGIGKTRLALALAAEQRPRFADGVFFVELGKVRDPALVQSTIADHAGLRETGRLPLREALRDHFTAKHALLVLDNFEHLLAAASVITDLLGACPNLCVVVTSRAALRVGGEYEYAVPPLELPAAALSTAHQLAENDAINLFVERARAVDARFKLVDQNAPVVAAICRRLDGVPLAIELAAARARVLSPEALLTRLDRPLPLLVGQRRDVPARQQTLRAALKWSFDLLTPEEQALFRRLAVFVGGWTAEAAEAVCALYAEERATVLDRLEALTAHSQVQFNGQRFTMLETIREFAQDELERRGEQERFSECHAAFFLAWAEQAVPHLERTEGAAWLDELECDHANLQAALRWAIENGKVDWALRLGDALRLFWGMRGHTAVGRSLLEAALARPRDTVDTAVRARALDTVGYLARCQGDWAAAGPLFEQTLAVRRQIGDRHGVADSLINVGGALQQEARGARARECYEDALRIYRELDHKQGIAEALSQLGHLETDEEHLDLARSLHEQSLALWRELGDQFGVGWALGHLADLAVLVGDVAPAHALLAERIRINSALASVWGVASTLEGFARLAVAQGRTSRALRLAGAAAALRAQAGTRLTPSDETWLQECLASAWSAEGPDGGAQLYGEGERMGVSDAVDYALLDDEQPPAMDRRELLHDPELTAREWQIVRLVGQGLTNPEIAQRLVIGKRTVDTHVEHIRNKLTVRSRAQIAAWLAQHELYADGSRR